MTLREIPSAQTGGAGHDPRLTMGDDRQDGVADLLPHPAVPWPVLPWPDLPPDDLPDLISLDVFDTLLLRRVETPVAVFDMVGRRAAAAGLVDQGLSPALFRLARQEAERRARQAAPGGEATLAAIYGAAALGDPEALARLELAVEADLLVANPLLLPVLEALAAAGRPAVLLSDTFFAAEDLRVLLRGAGIGEGLYQTLYASCDHGCSKADGGLFRRLLADHPQLPPGRILHVGDDPRGDVAMARAAGLRTLHYVPGPALARLRERERAVAGLSSPAPLPLRRLAALAGLRDDPADAFWLEFGSLVLGPAVTEYCRWVVEDCRTRGIGLIAPLMREAVLFAPLMRDWVRHRGYPIRVVPLFVSREALAPLELAGLDAARARAILTAKPYLSWDRLLGQAGGRVPEDLALLAGLTVEELSGQPMADGTPALERVLALFDAPEVQETAALRAVECQVLVLEHLRERLGEEELVALVDLGARGTTLVALARLMPGRPVHGYLCYASPELAGPLTDGLRVSVYAGQTDRGMALARILYRTPQILERALTGLDGTTIGYGRDAAGRCTPITAPPPATGAEARALALLQAGIRRYTDGVLATHSADGDPCLPMGEDALLPLAAALLMPTAVEADALGGLAYDQNDGTDAERMICDTPALEAVRPLAGLREGPLAGLALGLRRAAAPWPQGALTRLDPGVFRRHADALALDAGHGPVSRALVAHIRAQGLERVAVVAVGGDGGMGPDFIRAAHEAGLVLVAYADLIAHLVAPPLFHGVPVMTLEELPALAPVPLALVTLGYADRLAALARERFAAAGRPLRLVALARPDLEGLPEMAGGAVGIRTTATG